MMCVYVYIYIYIYSLENVLLYIIFLFWSMLGTSA